MSFLGKFLAEYLLVFLEIVLEDEVLESRGAPSWI
jgi:hypothetical protein